MPPYYQVPFFLLLTGVKRSAVSEVVKDWAQSIKVVYLVVLPPFTSLNYILGKVFSIRITFLHKGFPLKGFYVAERVLAE